MTSITSGRLSGRLHRRNLHEENPGIPASFNFFPRRFHARRSNSRPENGGCIVSHRKSSNVGRSQDPVRSGLFIRRNLPSPSCYSGTVTVPSRRSSSSFKFLELLGSRHAAVAAAGYLAALPAGCVNSICKLMVISSLTIAPPLSRTGLYTMPNSLRLIFVVAAAPMC
jgi:hypothetical protein